jgi:hypothetical protein
VTLWVGSSINPKEFYEKPNPYHQREKTLPTIPIPLYHTERLEDGISTKRN